MAKMNHMNMVTTPPDQAAISALQSKLVAALKPILPEHALLWEPEDTIPYECDGLAAYRRMPLAVALPETEEQAAQILKICYAMQVPVVPRGSGTGLSGGAMPIAQGLVLSLAKLKKIVSIDPFTRTAVVQPGVRNLAISEAVAHLGLYYAPDPSSQIACSIGGNINENSEFGSLAPDSPGLDLLAIMIGSEGMLAVVTEVTVKLVAKPKFARVIMASFDDIEKGGDAVAAIIAAGIIPAGLEMMDKATTRAVEEFVHAGYDLNAEAILLCESDGTPEEVAEEIERMTKVLEEAGASGIQISQDESERLKFWSGRKNAFPAAGRLAADYYCMDGTIPRRHIATLLKRIQVMEKKYGLGCLNVFHAGDGNMHPLILFNGADQDEWHRAEDFGTEILEACVELGGTITGEHGVGIEKINSMCVQFGEGEREAFWGVKEAFDPERLLNPDKAIPTLHRCAEYGRMRISGGALPFPELERF
jgi:glycolate oxidase